MDDDDLQAPAHLGRSFPHDDDTARMTSMRVTGSITALAVVFVVATVAYALDGFPVVALVCGFFAAVCWWAAWRRIKRLHEDETDNAMTMLPPSGRYWMRPGRKGILR
jgi:hypothetical protein